MSRKPNKINLTNEQIKYVCDLYFKNEHISVPYLQKMFSLSRRNIERILKNNNITIRKNQSSFLQTNKKYNFDKSFFFSETNQTAYFMGFSLADGSLIKSNRTNSWNININKKDDSILHMFCDWLKIPIDSIKSRPKNMIRLRFADKIFAEDFSKWGIVPNKTYKPVIPTINSNIIKPFLIGLIDGDGSIQFSKDKGYCLSLTGNIVILDWFIDIIKNLGYLGKYHYFKSEKGIWGRVRIANRKSILELSKILEINRCDFCLSRKWLNIKSDLNK